MRGFNPHRFDGLALGLAVSFLVIAGCATTTRSGLPEHINTVEVHIFQNKTMYKGLEGILTRAIIDGINADPRVRVATNGGDALITGEITNVSRSILRETTTNEPGTVLITIEVTFSFYDAVNGIYLINDAVVTSTDTGLGYGIYEASRGARSSEGERGALEALAGDIVRRTVGMW